MGGWWPLWSPFAPPVPGALVEGDVLPEASSLQKRIKRCLTSFSVQGIAVKPILRILSYITGVVHHLPLDISCEVPKGV